MALRSLQTEARGALKYSSDPVASLSALLKRRTNELHRASIWGAIKRLVPFRLPRSIDRRRLVERVNRRKAFREAPSHIVAP